MLILLVASCGDVYSFGVILLELLIVKEPTGSDFKGCVEKGETWCSGFGSSYI